MSEQIIVPIIIDPKAGVAGLKAVGDQAVKTGQQVNESVSAGGKFGSTMKNIGMAAITAAGGVGIMSLAVQTVVTSFLDWIRTGNKTITVQERINKLHDAAVASTMDEVVALRTLFSVAQNETNTKVQRQNAIDQLNKKYPEYLKNLSLENVNTLEIANAMDRLVASMITKEQLQQTIQEIAKIRNEADKLFKDINLNKVGKGGPQGIVNSGLYKIWVEMNQQAAQLQVKANQLQAQVLGDGDKGGNKGEKGISKMTVRVKNLKIKADKIDWTELMKPSHQMSVPGEEFQSAGLTIEQMFPGLQKKYGGFNSTPDLSLIKAMQDDKLKKAPADMYDQWSRVSDLIGGTLAPAFEGMFDAIITAGNPLKSFFQGLMSSVANLIKQLMSAAVYAGVLSLVSGGASNAKNGGLSFSKAFAKVLGFSEGGLVTGPVSALVGEGRGTSASNPEVVAPLDKLKSFFADMIAPNRGFNTNGMGMAAAFVNMPGEVVLRANGRDLVGTLKLEQLSQLRTG